MVGSCANPECRVPFRYFGEGKLFHFEVGSRAVRPGASTGRIERFWLCHDCCSTMTLELDRQQRVVVTPQMRSRTTGLRYEPNLRS